jgi:hypothetical protein
MLWCLTLFLTGLIAYGQAVSSFRPSVSTIQRGLFASVSACTTVPFIYTTTDSALQGFCDGVSHLDWKYKGLTVTPTVVADLPTWFNQGGGSVSSNPGSWFLIGTTGAGDNWRGRYKAVPVTPYSVVTCLEGLAAEKNSGGFGMFWTDGTALIPFAYVNQVVSGPPILFVGKYSTATAFSGFYTTTTTGVTGTGLFCMAMIDDGVNRAEKYSFDKKAWIPYHSVGNTDFLTATGVGVIINDAATTPPPQVQVFSMETLASAL